MVQPWGRKYNYFYGNTIFCGSLHAYLALFLTGNINMPVGRALLMPRGHANRFFYYFPEIISHFHTKEAMACVFSLLSVRDRDKRLENGGNERHVWLTPFWIGFSLLNPQFIVGFKTFKFYLTNLSFTA